MKIVIILNEPYPFGMACTNRIQLYAKGLNNAGTSTKIIIPKPKIVDTNLNVQAKGTFDRVDYQYATKSAYRSRSFFKRRLDDSIGVLRSAFLCLQEKPDVLVFVGGGLFNIILYKLTCMLTKSLYYREKSEIPYMGKDSISKRQIRKLKREYSYFDGLIVITDTLGEFFTKDLGLNLKTIMIPILIEKTNTPPTSINEKENYLLYTGSLLDRKDGVITLLEAFSMVSEKHPELKLYITGNAAQSPDYKKIMEVITSMQLEQKIVFTGFVTQLELNQLIKNAKLSIVLKPENRQNKYNFPTKIGEYMILGCPVIATKNDTLTKIFHDKKTVFFTEFNAQEVAENISYAYTNPTLSEEVGISSKSKVESLFDADMQMNKLRKYFENELN